MSIRKDGRTRPDPTHPENLEQTVAGQDLVQEPAIDVEAAPDSEK